METKVSRILVEIDALFDTRIGTIARMDVNKAAELLHDPSYANRLWDFFPGVDVQAFKELYARRDATTLLNSQTTPLVAVAIGYHVRRCAETAYSQPVAKVPEIHINFWPYKLKPEEEDLIINTLKKVVPLSPVIEKINMSYEQLNPVYVRGNYEAMWLYHGHDWLTTHTDNGLLKQHHCQSVSLWCPVRLDLKPEGVEVPANVNDYFYSMSIFSQLLINLSYTGIDNFCSYLSVRPKKADQKEDKPTTEPEPSPEEESSSNEDFITGLQEVRRPGEVGASSPMEQKASGR